MPRKKKTLEDKILSVRARLEAGEVDELLAEIEAELYTLRRQINVFEAREARRAKGG